MEIVSPFAKPRQINIEEFSVEDSADLSPEWKPFEEVNRGNFASFLLEGFRASQGIRGAHYMLIRYTEVKSRMDIFGSIQNFLDSGGWSCLKDNEKEMLESAYKDVVAHWKIQITTDLSFPQMFNLELQRFFGDHDPRLLEIDYAHLTPEQFNGELNRIIQLGREVVWDQ